MKHRTKKLAFPMLLLLAALTACSSDGGNNPEQTKPSGTQTEDYGTETETAEPEYLPPVKDLDEYTMTIMCTDDTLQQNVSHEEMNGEPVNDAIHLRDAEVEELLHCHLNYITYGNNDDNYMRELVVKSVNAGDDEYDLVIGAPWFVIMRCEYTKVYLDLNEIPGISLHEAWWSPDAVESLNINGKLYFTVCPISPMYFATPAAVFFNKRLMNDNDFGDPYTWVREGQWTFDKMLSLTNNFCRDVNGDNIMIAEEDQFGVRLTGGMTTQILIACGVKQIESTGDGYVNNLVNQKISDIIDFLKPHITNPSVNPGGDAAFSAGRQLFDISSLWALWGADSLRGMEDDYGILPMPKWDEAQESYHSSVSIGPAAGVCVPTTVMELEKNGLIMENMAFYSVKYIQPAVYETALKGKGSRDVESEQMLDLIFATADYEFNQYFNVGNSLLSMGTYFEGTLEYSSGIQKIIGAVTKELDKLFK